MTSRDQNHSPARSFLAGSVSGVTKLLVGHPFDTVKVRIQTGIYNSPWACLKGTIINEGMRGLYKGATPPLIGWAFMDSLMLGSLHNYKAAMRYQMNTDNLPVWAVGICGMGAGWTVSSIASPVEHIKARLQIQHCSTSKTYHGPINCFVKIYGSHGIKGIYQGFFSTLVFRSWFFTWWGSYDLYTRWLSPYMSVPSTNFWAGGLSAQTFWLFSYPFDVVKQRIMADSLHKRRYPRWRDAWNSIVVERAFYKGFLPCFLRAFPANSAALVAFETAMSSLKQGGL